MALTIVRTHNERLINSAVKQTLRRALDSSGSAVLLVPSFSQAAEAQRALATVDGLTLGITTTTPSAWVRSQWELWGDGRSLANGAVLSILAYEAIRGAAPDERGPLAPLPGTVEVLAKLVGRSLPWLPFRSPGLDEEACAQAGLADAETRLVRLAASVAGMLQEHGYVSASEASALLPNTLLQAHVLPPHIVVAGFSWLERTERELVCALARITDVSFFAHLPEGPAAKQVTHLIELLNDGVDEVRHVVDAANDAPLHANDLQELLDVLFSENTLPTTRNTPIELLLPAGPVAEAELIASRIATLAAESTSTENPIVVVVPDVARAWRELAPKLEARGVAAQLMWTQPMTENFHAQAFISFVSKVAQLSELAASWPEPIQGLEGPVPQLGDMKWWPPRELIDFLFEDMAHMEPRNVWKLDGLWRGNRLLTPERVLEMLKSEKLTSPPVARATLEILRGRLGSAAAKLLAPYVSTVNTGNAAADESRAVLQAMLQLTRTLRELGVSYDPHHPEERPLSEVCSLLAWAAGGKQIVSRLGVGASQSDSRVLITTADQAAQLPVGSAHSLVVCGLTSVEQPLEGKEDVLHAMLELLGVEPKADSLAKARTEFRKLLGIAREQLVLERALADAEGAPTYPSVMLSELLGAYGVSASTPPAKLPFAHESRSERDLLQNLNYDGNASQRVATVTPAPAGKLTSASRNLVFVPQAGKEALPNGLPVLSASQIETYLDCPYKWFSLRRLRLGSLDAGHTGLEMGSFAHRVLEVTHTELLARALEQEQRALGTQPPVQDEANREALLAELAANPCRHIPGSRIDATTLEAAKAALELEFDLHREHMYLERNPRASQQLLVAHDSAERAQEQQLREDLLSSLKYQTGILEGFEPRFFEWDFGRHGELVPYAGAYITGTADRIDVSQHGTAVIIDYKHKSPNGFAAEYDALQDGVLDGAKLPTRVQSLIYGQVVRRAFEGNLRIVGSVYLSTKAPHALAGVADANVADLVFGPKSSRRLPYRSVPSNESGEPGMNDLLDRTEELIAEQVQQMLAGNVEARPRDRRSCDFCPVMQCERRVAQ